MRRVSQQEWENEHMHNPMTEGEALAVDVGALHDAAKFLAGRYSDHDGWVVAIRAAASALTAHTAASAREKINGGTESPASDFHETEQPVGAGRGVLPDRQDKPATPAFYNSGYSRRWNDPPPLKKKAPPPPAAVPADALERLVEKWEKDATTASPLSKKNLTPARFIRELAALIPKGADHGQR